MRRIRGRMRPFYVFAIDLRSGGISNSTMNSRPRSACSASRMKAIARFLNLARVLSCFAASACARSSEALFRYFSPDVIGSTFNRSFPVSANAEMACPFHRAGFLHGSRLNFSQRAAEAVDWPGGGTTEFNAPRATWRKQLRRRRTTSAIRNRPPCRRTSGQFLVYRNRRTGTSPVKRPTPGRQRTRQSSACGHGRAKFLTDG